MSDVWSAKSGKGHTLLASLRDSREVERSSLMLDVLLQMPSLLQLLLRDPWPSLCSEGALMFSEPLVHLQKGVQMSHEEHRWCVRRGKSVMPHQTSLSSQSFNSTF